MIPRYSNPEMARIWSEQRRYETWLQVEVAAAEAMADAGLVPVDAARDLREKGSFDIARIEGQVKASSVRKVADFVEKHPEESTAILRNWVHEG